MNTLVWLWTDVLLDLFVGGLIVLAVASYYSEPLRRPWRRVLRKPLGMATLVILLCYLLIALLDSIHFSAPTNVQPSFKQSTISVLDWWLNPLGQRDEKTYSAPFSTHLYSKEMITTADEHYQRDYPALQMIMPVAASVIIQHGLWMLMVAGLGLTGIVLSYGYYQQRYRQQIWRVACWQLLMQRTIYPWRTLLLTVTMLIVSLLFLIDMSQYYHVLGTDQIGQDVFYKALKSVRTGMLVGCLTTLIMLPFAVGLGCLAGYYGGVIDDLVQYLYTTLSAVPGVLLIAAAILSIQVFTTNHPELFSSLAMQADLRLLALCVILGVTSWTSLCRLLRAEAFKIRELDYVQAARLFGASGGRIIVSHIIPNVIHLIVMSVVLDFSGLVLAEAVLSYVGIGVDPSTMSWGNMINSARLELARAPVVWWPLLAAFCFMFVLVLSANLFSDVVRDAFDPKYN